MPLNDQKYRKNIVFLDYLKFRKSVFLTILTGMEKTRCFPKIKNTSRSAVVADLIWIIFFNYLILKIKTNKRNS